MTTDQLIELLAADLTPVERRRMLWTIILAFALGTAAAFGAMLLIFNPRPERKKPGHPVDQDPLCVRRCCNGSGVLASTSPS
jgi:hypothetical protein